MKSNSNKKEVKKAYKLERKENRKAKHVLRLISFS